MRDSKEEKNLHNVIGYKVRFWLSILLTVFTVVLAIVFITQIADIYYSAGDEIYSRAIVSARLKKLIAPMVVWLVLAIASFVMSCIFKLEKKQQNIFNKSVLARLKKRLPEECPDEVKGEYKRFLLIEKIKTWLYGLATGFSLGSAIYAISFLTDVSYFPIDANVGILNLVRYVFPLILASFLLFAVAVIVEVATNKQQLALVKKIIAVKKVEEKKYPILEKFKLLVAFADRKSPQIVWAVRIVVLAVAFTFIGLGIWNDGFRDVMYKAINICTECIGLG